ncbi:MAG TPA: DUF1800 domain-containing protein [Gemmatimonadaceae bacterium]|nr:DUF1800 domain-containing protein [Gemmatimonadaceae bacterium]
MIRRQLIPVVAVVCAAGSLGAQAKTVSPRPAAPRLDHRELPADQQIVHALNRLTFGARPGDAQKVRAFGLDKWIDQQLEPEKIDDSQIERFLECYSVLNQDQNALLAEYVKAQEQRRSIKRAAADDKLGPDDDPVLRRTAMTRRQVVAQLQSARVARAVAGNRQLEEVITDFWLNHFNVFAGKGPPQAYYLAGYERSIIRPNALGKFRDLLGAVAKSPAMLFYLDNMRSMADSTRPHLAEAGRNRRAGNPDAVLRVPGPRGRMRMKAGIPPRRTPPPKRRGGGLNENYGRELLELHTMGVDGGYTQQDVINVARALTGWTVVPAAAGGGFIFRAQMHDAGEKIVLGHQLKAGRGIEDGEEVLDIVARHPATARYISEKLVRRFVSDEPPAALVDEAAAVFTKTDGDIRAVVRAIVTSNEFFSQRAYRSKVKSPFEVVVSAMRAMNAAPDSTPRTAQVIAYLGQPIYGHQAPNGYPETGDPWMNTGAILSRINFGMAAAANRVPGARVNAIPGIDTLASAPRPKQVDAVASLLLGGSISSDTRAVLLSGEHPLLANRTATALPEVPASDVADGQMQRARRSQTPGAPNGDVMTAQPKRGKNAKSPVNALGRPGAALTQLTGIAQVVGLALGSPEFQRH